MIDQRVPGPTEKHGAEQGHTERSVRGSRGHPHKEALSQSEGVVGSCRDTIDFQINVFLLNEQA